MKLRTPFAAMVAANSLVAMGPADAHRGSTAKTSKTEGHARTTVGSASALGLAANTTGLFGHKGAVFQKFDETGFSHSRVAMTDDGAELQAAALGEIDVDEHAAGSEGRHC